MVQKNGSKPTGAASRYKYGRSQKFVMVQKLAGVQMRVSGCRELAESRFKAGIRKNRDEFINSTVRVSG
jgi:hypothetical protein